MAGYRPLKSLSLRERRWTFPPVLKPNGAESVQLQLSQPLGTLRQGCGKLQQHRLDEAGLDRHLLSFLSRPGFFFAATRGAFFFIGGRPRRFVGVRAGPVMPSISRRACSALSIDAFWFSNCSMMLAIPFDIHYKCTGTTGRTTVCNARMGTIKTCKTGFRWF
ncbi:MAG: hypothetical protein JWN34_1806 [Bryobacterales bacterium]|nr:hypothetical protein [Bryobacterales bacterium]